MLRSELYKALVEGLRCLAERQGLHSAHPCASPFGQRSCAKRLSCRFVEPVLTACHSGQTKKALVEGLRCLAERQGLHSAHPCASPFGQRSCAKRLSCRFVEPVLTACHSGQTKKALVEGLRCLAERQGLHSAHPCASPFGQRSCAKRLSCRFVEPVLTACHSGQTKKALVEGLRCLAERQGFEPWNTREDVTGIPVQRLRPLGHLSESQVSPHESSIMPT